MKKILCEFSNDNLGYNNGVLNKINKFCESKISSLSCQKFYSDVQESDDGVFVCPYGFNCIKKGDKIYNCLLIKNQYNKSKIKQKKDLEQRIFAIEELNDLIDIDCDYQNKLENIDFSFRNMSDFLHDITRANKMIESKYRSISKKGLTKKDSSHFESIYHLSDFITKRIDLYRYVSNPAIIEVGKSRVRDAFKLWDIYRYMFIDLGYESNIFCEMHTYNMNGEETKDCCTTFYANDAITVLPFLLMDNAIKYSVNDSVIKINFYQQEGILKRIVMKSTPSYEVKENPNDFFRRGYRSANNTSKSSGSGLGLSIVRQICDYNNININIFVELDENKKQNFVIVLEII